MPVAIIVTAPDQPGLAKTVGEIVRSLGGNIATSRMVTLGSEFVVAALVTRDDDEAGFAADVERRLVAAGFDARVKRTHRPVDLPYRVSYDVRAVSLDHPGIVEALADTIRAAGGNIVEAETDLGHAPWSGAPTFTFSARVLVPDIEHGRKLRLALDQLAADRGFDVRTDATGP